MATGIDLSLSGLASGFDWKSLVAQIVQAERAPEAILRAKQGTIAQRNSAFDSIKTQLGDLKTAIDALNVPALFDSRTVQVSDPSIGSATAGSNAAPGSYTFNIIQLAAASAINGTTNAGAPLSSSADVSSLVLSSAGFASPITAGTFSVNGQQVTIATSDTLKQVFDKISTATNGQVTATYNPTSDKISLSSSNEIVLGSATDTSNFLRVAHLANNGTGSISSSVALGGIRVGSNLASAGFATAVSDGGNGAGEFKINGVSISYNASIDSVSTVLDRINNSGAGVTASYDALNDRFVLTSAETGDIGIGLQDVTGNFLAASGLSAGALSRGKDLLYSVNGGPQLSSQSNVISEDSSGLTGLSVTALKENASLTVTVGTDTDKIKTAIQNFVDAYNKVQTFIGTQTASSTDASGNVTTGLLAGDSAADSIASGLRTAVFSSVTGLSGTLSHLSDLGYQTNGYDNKIALSDSTQLDASLQNHLRDVKAFFSDSTSGLAARLDTFLEHEVGDDGPLATHQTSLTKQSAAIDAQIAQMEKSILAEQTRLTNEFIAMETAQAQINQQLSYLSQTFK